MAVKMALNQESAVEMVEAAGSIRFQRRDGKIGTGYCDM